MTLLATKLKNRISKEGNYVVEIKNTNINGRKVGCYGFVSNPENKVVVYIDTEKLIYYPLADKNLIRYAVNNKDYTGCRNNFVTDDRLVSEIVFMLNNHEKYERELTAFGKKKGN